MHFLNLLASFIVSVRQCRYDNRSDSSRLIRDIRFYFLGNSQEQNQGRLGAVESGPGQSRVIRVIKIPLNLPLLKGDFNYPTVAAGP